jgi:hypothetical protein
MAPPPSISPHHDAVGAMRAAYYHAMIGLL